MSFSSQFNTKGFALQKSVFSKDEIATFETEFDRIVDQLQFSNEHINARWGSRLTQHIENFDWSGHYSSPYKTFFETPKKGISISPPSGLVVFPH